MNLNTEMDIPLILAFETATPVSSVALFLGKVVVGNFEFRSPRLHGKMITVMAESLITELGYQWKDLSAIAVSKGPGSYTGLRVGVSAAKGYCLALDIPLIGISSLEGMASQWKDVAAFQDALICPMIDARRMEVYCAVYDGQMNEVQATSAKVIEEDAFSELLKDRKIIFCGSGAEKCRPVLGNHPNALILGDSQASATSFTTPAMQRYVDKKFENLVTFEPYYLKDFVATQSKKKLL